MKLINRHFIPILCALVYLAIFSGCTSSRKLGIIGPPPTNPTNCPLGSTDPTCKPPEKKPPIITGPIEKRNITTTSATIAWSTNEPADGVIQYDSDNEFLDGVYNTITPTLSPSTSHSFSLVGLIPNTLYHLRVVATAPDGLQTVSGDQTFQTLALPALPVVSFVSAGLPIYENVNSASISFSVQNPVTTPATVQYSVGGTASQPGDHTLTNNFLTIQQGQTSGSITFSVNPDTIDELDETVIVTLTVATNATLGTTTVHTATIIDDDPPPTAYFSSSQAAVNETALPLVNATIELDKPSEKVASVSYTTHLGTASYLSDHTLNSSGGAVTFNPGEISKNISFSIAPDSLDESDETVILVLGNATNAVIGSTPAQSNTTTFTITDDDPLPVISIPTTNQLVGENSQARIPLMLNQVSGRDVTVSYNVVGGTASNPGDYILSTNRDVTIAAGSTSGEFVFNLVDDPEPPNESTETVVVALTNPINTTVDTSRDDHTVTISDVINLPSVSFSPAAQSAPEEVGSVTITASLSSAYNEDVLVPYLITGTASNSDYQDLGNGSITISAGSQSASTTISVVDDPLNENNETVIVTMQALTNATGGASTVHTLTITDNDSPPSFSFSIGAESVPETIGNKLITVNLSAESSFVTSVNYSVGGGTADNPEDHTLSDNILSFPAGTTSQTILIPVINDTLDEDDETVIITLSDPSTNANLGSTTVYTLTIQDSDALPTVSLSISPQTPVTEGVETPVLTVTLSAVSGRDVTVPFTVGGTASKPNDSNPDDDHDLEAGTFTINKGSTNASKNISISNDTLDEISETIIVSFGTPITNASPGPTTTQTITINDNDNPPIVQFSTSSQTILVESGTVTVTATLTPASGQTVTVDYAVTGSAARPGDYNNLTTGSPLTFAAGETTKSFTFDIVNDTLDETDETVILTLSNATNATLGTLNPQTVTITDNDAPPTVNFTAASQSKVENAGTATVTAQLNNISGLNVTVPYTVGGTAGSSDHNLTNNNIVIAAGSPSYSVTFNITDDPTVEPDETVIVTMGAVTNGTAGATSVHTVTILANDADVTPPVVSGQSVTETRSRRFTVSWSTNEDADSKVTCSASGVPTVVVTNNVFVTGSRSIRVETLNELTGYSCRIESKDRSGNINNSVTVTATTLSNVYGFIFNLFLELLNRTPVTDTKSIDLLTGLETNVPNGLPDEVERHVFGYNEYYRNSTTGTIAEREQNARSHRALIFALSGEFKIQFANVLFNLILRRSHLDNTPPTFPEYISAAGDGWVLQQLQHLEKVEDLNLNGVLDTNPFGNGVSEDRNSNGILNFTRFDPYGATSLRVDNFATIAGQWDLDHVIPGIISSPEYRTDLYNNIPHNGQCRIESSTETVIINGVTYPKIIGGIAHDIYLISRGNDADQPGIRYWSESTNCDRNDEAKILYMAKQIFTDTGITTTGNTPARDFWISKTAMDFWKRNPTTSEINALGDTCTRKTTGCRYLLELFPNILSNIIFYNLP